MPDNQFGKGFKHADIIDRLSTVKPGQGGYRKCQDAILEIKKWRDHVAKLEEETRQLRARVLQLEAGLSQQTRAA